MSDLPKKAQDRVNTFGVVLIGVVSAVLLWVSVVALQAYYNNTAGSVESERASSGKSREVRDLKAAQVAYLQEGKYVDPRKGLVTIPLDDAMRLVLRDAKAGEKSLVPAMGAHDQPTVPAVSGRPPDNLPPPAAPAGGAAPAPGGAAPAPGGAAPAPGGAAPAPGGAAAPPAQPDGAASPSTTPAPPPATPTPPPTTPPPPSPSPNP